MRPGLPVERDHRRWPEIEIPIKTGGRRARRAESLRPKNPAPIAVTVNFLQLADPSAPDEFAGHAEFCAVLAALLRARLINAAVTFRSRDHRLAFADRDGGRLFAIDIFA